jgi:hypothetical protein
VNDDLLAETGHNISSSIDSAEGAGVSSTCPSDRPTITTNVSWQAAYLGLLSVTPRLRASKRAVLTGMKVLAALAL